MNQVLISALKECRISVWGGTRFGSGSKRESIILEPFIQFRGGEFDILSAGAFSYMGGRGTNLRHVGSIGRFSAIAPGVVTGPIEHDFTQISNHSLLQGHWNQPWFELLTDFGLKEEQMLASEEQHIRVTSKRQGRILIGSDVWIGDGVFIRRGVTIGDGAVVAARSTVIKDVAPYEIVGGTPSRHLKWRFPPEVIARLLSVKWWDYGPAILVDADWTNVQDTLAILEARVEGGAQPWSPSRVRVNPDDTLSVDDGVA